MATAGKDPGYDSGKYFAMSECGNLSPDDRVELLEGLVVAMIPAADLFPSEESD